jgi:hypothetical protein
VGRAIPQGPAHWNFYFSITDEKEQASVRPPSGTRFQVSGYRLRTNVARCNCSYKIRAPSCGPNQCYDEEHFFDGPPLGVVQSSRVTIAVGNAGKGDARRVLRLLLRENGNIDALPKLINTGTQVRGPYP